MYLSGLLSNDTNPAQLDMQQIALRDFLSLYTVTRSDTVSGNGSWDELPVRNGDAVRAALFGSGQQVGALISGTHIGGSASASNNPYRNMNDILGRLGVASSAVEPHKHHFHVYLLPPAPVGITKHLRSDAVPGDLSDQSAPSTLGERDVQGLLDDMESLITGEELMFSMDVPYVPAQEAPFILADAASSGVPRADYLLKVCQETEHTPEFPMSALRGVDPAGWVRGYLEDKYNKPFDIAVFKPLLLQGTKHGKITAGISTESKRVSYRYDRACQIFCV